MVAKTGKVERDHAGWALVVEVKGGLHAEGLVLLLDIVEHEVIDVGGEPLVGGGVGIDAEVASYFGI